MADPALSASATLKRLDGWIATVCGIGLLPGAPGTWGSLAALPAGWAILHWTGSREILLLAAALAFFAGWWAADRYSRATGTDDSGSIVIDEVAGQWIVLAVVPMTLPWIAAAVILFRIFDIFKPWPIRAVERRYKGGFGVMIDDIVAGVFAAAVCYALMRALGGNT